MLLEVYAILNLGLEMNVYNKIIEDSTREENTSTNTIPKIVLVLFLLSLVSLLVLVSFYLFEKRNLSYERTDRQKSEAKRREILNNLDLGVVEYNRLDESGNKIGIKLYISAESTGQVVNEEMIDNQNGEKIADMTAINFKLADKSGNPVEMNLVVQIIPINSDQNIIPWYFQHAYKRKENENYINDKLDAEEISSLFEKGSRWTFMLLLRSNWQEGLLQGSNYVEYAKRYYNEDNWIYLENAFEKKFEEFSFDKPVLPQRLQYVQTIYD